MFFELDELDFQVQQSALETLICRSMQLLAESGIVKIQDISETFEQ